MNEIDSPPNPQPAIAAPSPIVAETTNTIDIDHFVKVNLRVARVEAAEKIEKSKKLLKLQVDLGPELGKRQILSGIAQFYTPESLIGKKIVIVANLKPAMMMGLESQGMLLAGSSADGSVLAILQPDDALPLGAQVR